MSGEVAIFPGAYRATDPGIKINVSAFVCFFRLGCCSLIGLILRQIWSSTAQGSYPYPGPALATFTDDADSYDEDEDEEDCLEDYVEDGPKKRDLAPTASLDDPEAVQAERIPSVEAQNSSRSKRSRLFTS